jgi:hypothetical protein
MLPFLVLLKFHGHAATHQLAAASLDDFDLVAANFAKIFLSNFRGHPTPPLICLIVLALGT